MGAGGPARRGWAYAVPNGDLLGLAAAMATRLPGWMIPHHVVSLPALLVTANGKLDRRALPAPQVTIQGRAAATPSEALVARLVVEVLGLAVPSRFEADFFTLGGDSWRPWA